MEMVNAGQGLLRTQLLCLTIAEQTFLDLVFGTKPPSNLTLHMSFLSFKQLQP